MDVLHQYGLGTAKRGARLSKDQIKAGEHFYETWSKSGQHVGSGISDKVDKSVDPKRYGAGVVNRLAYVKELSTIRSLVGEIAWSILWKVIIDDERTKGGFEYELMRQSLQLIFEEHLFRTGGKYATR